MHYLIRFQNTGTASAINVRIQNEIEEQLDWTTFRALDSSHELEVQLINQQIDFIFDNINLPDETSDLEGSQGYVFYRIKPIEGIIIGDTIENVANIFFDFNSPITTNTATTTFVEPLAIEDITIQNFDIFPNPAKDQIVLNYSGEQLLNELVIVDIQGKILKKESLHNFNGNKIIDTSNLAKGIYFIQFFSSNNKMTRKLIIK